jgi:hypothetical protein
LTIGAKINNNAKVIIVFLSVIKYPTLNPSPEREGLAPLPFLGKGVGG